LVNILKTLSEKKLVNIFWKTLVESDTSALTKKEKKAIKQARVEFAKGETIKWESLK
jgi:quercetin dioxygenase-like cupin family protein